MGTFQQSNKTVSQEGKLLIRLSQCLLTNVMEEIRTGRLELERFCSPKYYG